MFLVQLNSIVSIARKFVRQSILKYLPFCSSRYFVDDHNLLHHMRSKVHKQRIEEAERAAGKGQYRPPKPVQVPTNQLDLHQMDTDAIVIESN
jgi:hypothetical protein